VLQAGQPADQLGGEQEELAVSEGEAAAGRVHDAPLYAHYGDAGNAREGRGNNRDESNACLDGS
jgi:hypothetical protein